jgi:hypothetical protein
MRRSPAGPSLDKESTSFPPMDGPFTLVVPKNAEILNQPLRSYGDNLDNERPLRRDCCFRVHPEALGGAHSP